MNNSRPSAVQAYVGLWPDWRGALGLRSIAFCNYLENRQ